MSQGVCKAGLVFFSGEVARNSEGVSDQTREILANMGTRIFAYYRFIDQSDIDAVMTVFDEDTVYRRADSAFHGKARLEQFFREERRIRGQHIINDMHVLDSKVIVTGRFEGTGEQGDPRSVGFADFWTFNANGLVSLRETYLAIGNEIVLR